MYMLGNLLLNLLSLCWILEDWKTGSSISQKFEQNKTKVIINRSRPRTYNSTQAPIVYQRTDFLELVTYGHLTIDKTLLIRYVVLHPANVILLTCPSKWGKTTNLKMIEMYLEFRISDSDGEGRRHYRNVDIFWEGLLMNGKTLGDTFLISQYEDVDKYYLSRWPVVYVDFSNIVASNFATFRNSLEQRITNSYEKFRRVKDFLDYVEGTLDNSRYEGCAFARSSDELNVNRDIFAKYLRDCWSEKLNDTEIIEGLYLLTKILYERFDRKVFVLVDEYDSPFNLALLDPNFEKQDRIMAFNFYKNMLDRLLNDNEYMKKSVLTGTFKFNEQDLFPEQKKLSKYDFSNHYLHYFGISEFDLRSICQYMGLSPETETEIKRWCNGYSINSVEPPLNVANLGCVAQYFLHYSFNRNFEKGMRSVENLLPELMKSMNFFRKLCHLVGGGSTRILDDASFSINHSKIMMKYVDGQSLDEAGMELATKLLLAAGYFTHSDKRGHPFTHMCIPNIETYHAFGRSFDIFINKQQPSLRGCYHALIDSFLEFATNEEITSHKLEENLSSFLRVFPHFMKKGNLNQSETYERSISGNEKIVRSLIVWMGMSNTSNFYFSGGQARFAIEGNASMPKGVFVAGSRGIICELKYGDEYVVVGDMMARIKGEVSAEILPHAGQRFRHINDFKLIFVQVCQNTSTKIATEVIPARSLEKRGCP